VLITVAFSKTTRDTSRNCRDDLL